MTVLGHMHKPRSSPWPRTEHYAAPLHAAFCQQLILIAVQTLHSRSLQARTLPGNRACLRASDPYTDEPVRVQGVQLVNSQPNKTVNCIAWSPQGRFLVLGGLKAMQGQLEFFNADDFEVRLCPPLLVACQPAGVWLFCQD